MKTKVLYAALLILPLLFTSCKKEDINAMKTGRVAARIANDNSTSPFDEVNIDIRGVEVKIAGSTGGDWYKLNTNAGVYNMLSLSNGNNILLADQQIPTGQIMAVRLKLGSENTVNKHGTLYSVSIAPEDQAGLEAEVNEAMNTSTLNLDIDFSAGQSIVEDTQETFHLKPVVTAHRSNQ